jgi:6-phosphofructokinase 1
MSELRTIGILTAGGDCPGLNAVIRAVAKPLLAAGVRVVGIEDGFLGLIEDRVRPLHEPDIAGILALGGTILGSSNRSNPLRFCTGRRPDGSPIIEDVSARAFATLERHGIASLVVIGGDGSMSCATSLRRAAEARGIPLNLVGVPKTIDNDIVGTEITFGFQSAVATATDAIDKLRTTAASHHRVMVVELMGRNAGWLALYAGVAGGADIILLPEIPWSYEAIAERVRQRQSRGRRYSIIAATEGSAPRGGAKTVDKVDAAVPDPVRLGGVGRVVADELERRTGIECRAVVLGHMQRGGAPVPGDRILATQFGHHAARLALEGRWGRLAVVRAGRLDDTDIQEAADRQRLVPADDPVLAAARGVWTSFGD